MILQSSSMQRNLLVVKLQVVRILNLVVCKCMKIYRTYNVVRDKKTVDIIIIFGKLKQYCKSKINKVMEDFIFFTRKQDWNESFDKFYVDLRSLIKNCDFGSSEGKLLRSQNFLGKCNNDLLSKILREDLKLKKVVRTVK